VVRAADEPRAARLRRDHGQGLTRHPDFEWTNPNRFRALFGGLAGNHAGFHQASGAGYDFLADWLIRLDARNPQFAARMSTAFETWRRYDAARQARARAALERIGRHDRLSADMGEMVERMLDQTDEATT
jgi:aminopeptidase N